MACRRDIDKLLSLLPPKDRRQTVLFSATFPRDTNELCKFALRPSFAFVDTVGEDTIDTNKQASSRDWLCRFARLPTRQAWLHSGLKSQMFMTFTMRAIL